jgi:hypothetical protein
MIDDLSIDWIIGKLIHCSIVDSFESHMTPAGSFP